MTTDLSDLSLSISSWDPAYGSAVDFREFQESDQQSVDDSVEMNSKKWKPLHGNIIDAPPEILFVDGIQRIEARLEIYPPEFEVPQLALWAATGAGAVCWNRRERKSEFLNLTHRRVVVLPKGIEISHIERLKRADIDFEICHAVGTEFSDLQNEVHAQMAELESQIVRATANFSGNMVIADGRIRSKHPPGTLGYVKSHERRYLSGRPAETVPNLYLEQRTPIFRIDGQYPRYSWYIRVGYVPRANKWQGIARLEVSAELELEHAMRLADISAVVIPIAAPPLYMDPRAPQNLVPIAALERELRRGLGDPELLNRKLRVALHEA
ncbi:MAG TPA: hypothetical protein EYQ00_07590 [Dehalococcoidia bacterium]|jgi:hypothetical protein|nr:hypothetical protein [Dehalococcoidia bacterium]